MVSQRLSMTVWVPDRVERLVAVDWCEDQELRVEIQTRVLINNVGYYDT